MPPGHGAVRWAASMQRSTLYPYVFMSAGDGLKPTFLRALALGLFSGALATYLYLCIMWETYRWDPVAYAQGNPASFAGSYMSLLNETGKKISSLVTAFKFFPSFLALGYVGYAITRWRSFQDHCFAIQGALCNASLMVGGSLTRPHDDDCKLLAFKIYRYLQTIHILVYMNRNEWYSLLEMEDFTQLGLLTTDELAALNPAGNKMIEVLVGWIVRACRQGTSDGLLSSGPRFLDPSAIRGKVSAFNNSFILGQPNLWAALMKLVCDCLIFMFVLGSSFESFLYQLGPFQPYAVIFSIFLAVPWLCAQRMVTVLEDPFKSRHDMFNPDALVAGAERTIFFNLRCGWDAGDASWLSAAQDDDASREGLDAVQAHMAGGTSVAAELAKAPRLFEGRQEEGVTTDEHFLQEISGESVCVCVCVCVCMRACKEVLPSMSRICQI